MSIERTNLVKSEMFSEKLARELTVAIRNNITIDWSVRKSAQAGMRRIIKQLLNKYDYPSEQVQKTMGIVMKQAEKMCGNQVDLVFYVRVVDPKSTYKA